MDSSGGTSQTSSNFGSYASNLGSPNTLADSISLPSSVHYHKIPPTQGYGPGHVPVMPAKTAGASGFPVPYGDEMHETYSAVSSHFTLPAQESLGSCASLGTPDSLRGWNSMNQNAKASSGLYLDGEVPQYGNPQLSFVNPISSRMSMVAADGPSFFPGLASLSSSLPPTSATGDRVLPKPHHHPTPGSSSQAGSDSLPSSSYAPWEGLSGKPVQQTWTSDSRPSGGVQDSRKASSGSTSMMFGISASKGSLGPSQESPLGYVPMLSGSVTQGPSAAGNTYSTAAFPAPGASYNIFAAPDMASVSSGTPVSDSPLPSQQSSSDLYSYSTGSAYGKSAHGTRAGSNEGTLVSGQPYTRLNQTQSTQATPLTSLRRDSQEFRSQTAHRPSVGGFRA